MKLTVPYLFALLALTACCGTACRAQQPAAARTMQFDFGPGRPAAGYTSVTPATLYSEAAGYGFEPGNALVAQDRGGKGAGADFITAAQPFFFSVRLPEGNYTIKVVLGDPAGTADAAIRAECRRMMAERVVTGKGVLKTVQFTIHIRDTLIRGSGGNVRLKPRERAYRHWDNKLTLEFNGAQPKVAAVDVSPAGAGVTTVFLAGNSTVVDQASEPYASWGQMIPAFFRPGKVAVANYAESGESLSSFIAARRLEKMLGLMQPGDYALVEFGHNDQKQKGEGIGAFSSYKKDLKFFIAEVRKRGGIPVLVTPVQRRSFDSAGRIVPTLGDYPEAVRQAAREEGTALIDLNRMTAVLYEAWGPAASLRAFVHYPARTFPGQEQALQDNTHFNPYGAFTIARCVAKSLRESGMDLARHLAEDGKAFDPARPGGPEDFYWPLSPVAAAAKPDGN